METGKTKKDYENEDMNNGRQTHNRKIAGGRTLSGKVTLFAKVTILPGDELPYHEHHGETEAYHILSGAGMYQDNDKTYRCRRA